MIYIGSMDPDEGKLECLHETESFRQVRGIAFSKLRRCRLEACNIEVAVTLKGNKEREREKERRNRKSRAMLSA
jgi:hypothetical protein